MRYELRLMPIRNTDITEFISLGNPERLYDFVVALHKDEHEPKNGPFPSSKVCHLHRGYPGPGETITVTCHAAMVTTLARYVYVYLEGSARSLSLCELEVYGDEGNHNICLVFAFMIKVCEERLVGDPEFSFNFKSISPRIPFTCYIRYWWNALIPLYVKQLL